MSLASVASATAISITELSRIERGQAPWVSVQALAEIGKDEDADGIKSWLRGQYAQSIHERRRGAERGSAGNRLDVLCSRR